MPLGLNAVDWVLLLVVLLATLRGAMRGLRALLVELAASAGGLFAARRLAPAVAAELGGIAPLPAALVNALAFAVTCGIVSAGLVFLGRLVLMPRLRLPVPSLPGAIAGFAGGLAGAALLAALLLTMPLPARLTRLAAESRLCAPLAAPALRVGATLGL